MLEINNLKKVYPNGKVAVDGVSIKLNAGDIYGFIGPNGAGKTTTLNSCSGILNFEEGDIKFGELSIKDNAIDFKKQISYLPDHPVLYEFMTANEYVNFISDIFEVSTEKRKDNAKKYSEMFALDKDMDKPIGSYSHGMKQKLAIIASLVHEPKLLMLDEPFVGLDPKSRHEFKELLTNYCKGGGTVFFSTHGLDDAQNLCNRIGIINNGKLVKEGKTSDVIKDKSLEKVFLELTNEE